MAAKETAKIASKIHPEMRSQDEELQVRRKALKAARMKAKVDAREEKEADRRLKMEEYKMMRVYPTKFPPFFLRERSGGMICRDEFYRWDVPEERENPEITLQLWYKPNRSTPFCLGEVGDLYCLELDLPNGSTMELSILVKSSEAELRDNPGLRLQFSVLDMGHCEKAYSVEKEAWQNYLLFRDENNKEDLDCRLLYHAICNRWEMGEVALNDFAQQSRSDLVMMMQRMEPGGDYPRPTVEESHLATEPKEPEPTPEMLRANEEEDAALENQVSINLDLVIRKKFGRRPSFKETLEHEEMVAKNLGSPRKRALKRKRLAPYPRRESSRFHPNVERQMNLRLNTYLMNVLDSDKKETPKDTKDDCKEGGSSSTTGAAKSPEKGKKIPIPEAKSTPPNSPATLKSWSSSGWINENEEDRSDPESDDEVKILPLDADGRFAQDQPEPAKQERDEPTKPEKDWLTSYKAAQDVNLVLAESREEQHDETVLSLMSSMSGIDVLDRSSELESLVRDSPIYSSDERNTGAESELSFNDSVEVFLAKHREESILTVSTSESSGDNSPTADPEGGTTGPTRSNEPKRGPSFMPGMFTYQGATYRWNVPPQGVQYPGGFVDDLAWCGIPKELWPFPVDAEPEVKNPDAGCDECKEDDKKK